jgi:hypothetical protein
MTLFNNICRQPDKAIEKQLAMRQLLNKSTDSKSWFINIKKILLKYEFSNINELLTNYLARDPGNGYIPVTIFYLTPMLIAALDGLRSFEMSIIG